MIAVPQTVLDALAGMYGASADQLDRFGGGHEESDGIVYAYPRTGRRLLLKIMAIPTQERRAGIFCLDERLRFVRFLGENGARIVFPKRSPQGNLYETFLFEAHTWVGYGMEGYEREHHLDLEWLRRLNLFIAYRRILMFIVLNDWIQSNPSLHASWKQMILSQPDVVGALPEIAIG
jgi:hypothetical protein